MSGCQCTVRCFPFCFGGSIVHLISSGFDSTGGCTHDDQYVWYAYNMMCIIWNTDVGCTLKYTTLLPVCTGRPCNTSFKMIFFIIKVILEKVSVKFFPWHKF